MYIQIVSRLPVQLRAQNLVQLAKTLKGISRGHKIASQKKGCCGFFKCIAVASERCCSY